MIHGSSPTCWCFSPFLILSPHLKLSSLTDGHHGPRCRKLLVFMRKIFGVKPEYPASMLLPCVSHWHFHSALFQCCTFPFSSSPLLSPTALSSMTIIWTLHTTDIYPTGKNMMLWERIKFQSLVHHLINKTLHCQGVPGLYILTLECIDSYET